MAMYSASLCLSIRLQPEVDLRSSEPAVRGSSRFSSPYESKCLDFLIYHRTRLTVRARLSVFFDIVQCRAACRVCVSVVRLVLLHGIAVLTRGVES